MIIINIIDFILQEKQNNINRNFVFVIDNIKRYGSICIFIQFKNKINHENIISPNNRNSFVQKILDEFEDPLLNPFENIITRL